MQDLTFSDCLSSAEGYKCQESQPLLAAIQVYLRLPRVWEVIWILPIHARECIRLCPTMTLVLSIKLSAKIKRAGYGT